MDRNPKTTIQREFLGWDAPLLPNVARYLTDRTDQRSEWSLENWTCVLPTTQAAIRFSECLRFQTPSQPGQAVLPKIVTVGEIAERLYHAERPIAIEFEQTLAWARVLRRHDAEALRALLPILPDSDSFGTWLELAGTLRRLAADLAAHQVRFSDVVALAESDADRERWSRLQRLNELYLAELLTAGLSDPHEQRRQAIEQNRVHSAGPIALVGTSDLNESVADLIRRVDCPLFAFIAAPASEHALFDDLGCLVPSAFADFQLAIEDHQLIAATDISDQALAVSEVVTDFVSRIPSSQITIGVTDPSHVAPIEIQVGGCGQSTHRNLGWSLASTAVGRLIECAASLLARPTWQSLAAIVRHADVHRYVQSKIEPTGCDFLVPLDQMMSNHYPVRLADELPAIALQRYPQVIAVKKAVLQWLGMLVEPAETDEVFVHTLSIAQWSAAMQSWLDAVYGPYMDQSLVQSKRDLTIRALAKTKEMLQRFASLSDHLDFRVTAATALETLAARLSDLRVTTAMEPDALAIRGWLDLALDDSAALVIVGFNHPFVPSAVTNDPFLPGSMRTKLGVADNERRYARDVYATQLMLSTRRDVRLVIGKQAADGSPTPPSRMLAAAPADVLARRIRNLLGSKRIAVPVSHRWDSGLVHTDLPIPPIHTSVCPVHSMSVTAFKMYLDCPYRFYLRHVLKLKPIDDAARELAANQFGDLVHGAVEHFGESDDRDEPNAARIFESLRYHLHRYAAQHFGDHAASAVKLQIRQAERRLRFLADEQSKRIESGWRIHATEASIDESHQAGITVDGKTMILRGRFDRIDRNLHTGQWAILDYKTHGHKPEKKHLRKNRETGEYDWIDLQLPLYRMMIPYLGIDAPSNEVQLGYFNVSDKADETRINIAEFDDASLAKADALIHECVRRIFACDFRPTEGRVQYDDYDMILQTGVASRLLAVAAIGDEDETGAES